MSRFYAQKTLSRTEIREITKKVYARDGGRCVLCGRKPVQVHEIEYRSKGRPQSEKIFRLENMVCLCEYHHRLWHESESFRKAAKARLKDLLACS